MKMNKKGFAELILIFLFLFVLGIMAFFVMKMQNAYSDSTIGAPENTIVTSATTGAANGFDIGFVVVVGLLFVGALITAIIVEVHPIFIWLGILVFCLIAYAISQMAQATPVVINNTTMSREIAAAPHANAIIQNIGIIIIGLGIIFMVALYAKIRGRQSA